MIDLHSVVGMQYTVPTLDINFIGGPSRMTDSWAADTFITFNKRNRRFTNMSQRVQKLTPEQQAQVRPWAEKWVAISLKTGHTQWENAELGITEAYDLAGRKCPPIVRVPSPRVGALACSLADAVLKGRAIRPHYLEDKEIHKALVAALGKKKIKTKKEAPPPTWYSWYAGQFWSYFAAYSSFFVEVCKWRPEKRVLRAERAYRRLCESAGYVWFHEQFAMVCARPTEIHFPDRRLHCETGPAISWPDGWRIYCLNGVHVPSWLVTTRAEDLDPAKIKTIQNDEIRKEFVRKVGIERIYQKLGGETLDEASFTNDTGTHEYKLVQLLDRPYLWMTNPSLEGIYHLERVSMDCTTVRDALAFRSGLSDRQISEDGEDWYQQGDVILRPKGAKQYKLFPKFLT